MTMSPHDPAVSVLLPVHNPGVHLAPALRSLAAQQEIKFEVVAIDDGSTDGAREFLQAAAKEYSWLRVFTQERSGVARTLNRGVLESRGRLIARMDADDLAASHRLRTQAQLLEREPAVGVCGSWFRVFGAGRSAVVKVPASDASIRARLVFGSALAHPAVMIRRELLAVAGGPYQATEEGVEDYGLWLRLAPQTRFHNVPEVLLHYRRHAAQVTAQANAERLARLERLRLDLLHRGGLRLAEAERRAHAATAFEAIGCGNVTLPEIGVWLARLADELPRSGWCDAATLRQECAEAWWRCCRRDDHGWRTARRFWSNRLAPHTTRTAWRALRLALGV